MFLRRPDNRLAPAQPADIVGRASWINTHRFGGEGGGRGYAGKLSPPGRSLQVSLEALGRINLHEAWTRPSDPALDTRPRSGNVRPGPVILEHLPLSESLKPCHQGTLRLPLPPSCLIPLGVVYFFAQFARLKRIGRSETRRRAEDVLRNHQLWPYGPGMPSERR